MYRYTYTHIDTHIHTHALHHVATQLPQGKRSLPAKTRVFRFLCGYTFIHKHTRVAISASFHAAPARMRPHAPRQSCRHMPPDATEHPCRWCLSWGQSWGHPTCSAHRRRARARLSAPPPVSNIRAHTSACAHVHAHTCTHTRGVAQAVGAAPVGRRRCPRFLLSLHPPKNW